MGVARIREISANLIRHGLAAGNARRHGALGHHRPAAIHRRHARHHRRRRGKIQIHRAGGDGHRRRRQAAQKTQLVRDSARCSAGASSSPARASRPASSPASCSELSAEVLEIPTIKIVPTDRQAGPRRRPAGIERLRLARLHQPERRDDVLRMLSSRRSRTCATSAACASPPSARPPPPSSGNCISRWI